MLLAHQYVNEDISRGQTLRNHSENVSMLMESYLDHIKIKNFAFLVGYLHDLGKAKQEFQDYVRNPVSYKRGSINHSSAGAIYLYMKYIKENNTKNQYSMFTYQMLGLAIMSHHSGLSDCLDIRGSDCLTKRLTSKSGDGIKESIDNFLSECVDESNLNLCIIEAIKEVQNFITLSIQLYGSERNKNMYALGMLEKHIFSCLLDADRYDTASFFNNIPIQVEVKKPDVWNKLANRLEAHIKTFNLDSEINKLRNEVSISCKNFAQNPQGIYQLYVPTGGGKTLASLRYALSHAKQHDNIQRIFYIIPFLTILTQNSKTLKEILEKGDESYVLEHFSNIVNDEKMSEKGNENDVEEKDALVERWDSEIIITSYVHFLESLFSSKGQAVRRMHQLSNAIIIIDEIQTLPDRLVYMFNQAMNYLKNFCNSTIILCSATQPTLQDVKYAIQLTKPMYMVEDYQQKFFEFKRVEVIDATRGQAYDDRDIVDFIEEKMQDIDNMLIILNTKKGVIDVYKEIEIRNQTYPDDKKYTVICLTTNMCPQHRHEKLEWIRANLNLQKVICVSTSLIEAGVDISFQSVIRAVTGLDSIAQAAGRCNRNGELQKGYVYLINTKEEGAKKLAKVLKGIQIMTTLLDEYKMNKAKFGNDILSPECLRLYYRKYYHESENELSYPSKDLNGLTMYSCLATNQGAVQKYLDENKGKFSKPPFLLNQSFHSAGKVFEVFEEKTMSLIVPYGEGQDTIIELLRKNREFDAVKKLLRKAQRYSINIYESKKNTLGIEYIEEYDIYILEEGNYDNEIGLVEFTSSANFI